MRILHTSDLHLAEDQPRTLHALSEILRVAREYSVDIITIAGDLFDSHEDAEALRPQLRKEFSSNDFEVIVIPGNHDVEAYKGNLDFGSDLKVAIKEPYELFTKDSTLIVALPFTPSLNEGLLARLKKETERRETTILLIHCTLDIGFSVGDFGEKETHKYCPISKATLSNLGFDYILAGHFHSNTTILQLGEKTKFVYPGSPVSHSTREIGKRQIVLIDTVEGDCKSIQLQSFYRDFFYVTVTPEKEEYVITKIREWINERRNDICSLKIVVDGFIAKDEQTFRREIEKVAEEVERANVEIEHLYRDVKVVLEHPLYLRFKEKLNEKNLEEEKQKKIEHMVINALARLIRGRELGK